MYVLAMLGNTGMGGGTSVEAIRLGLNEYVEAYGRRIVDTDGRLEMSSVSRQIDKGLPLMWACMVEEEVEKTMNQRLGERRRVTDWSVLQDQSRYDRQGPVLQRPQDARRPHADDHRL